MRLESREQWGYCSHMDKQPGQRSLTAAEKDLIIGRIEDLLREIPDIVAAYVFGSFARDEAFRDIDIGVLFDEPPPSLLEFELRIEADFEKVLKMPVDLRVLNGAPQSFAYTVLREGKILVDRNPNLRASYEGNIIKQYLDFSRFRKRSLRSLTDAGI
jgi:predicted nucleotidyltransferase